MPEWAEHRRLPVHLLLTGSDTLKRNPAKSPALLVQGTPDRLRNGFRAQVFSSKHGEFDGAHALLERRFAFEGQDLCGMAGRGQVRRSGPGVSRGDKSANSDG
jgi:hypothetical protein